jgi:thiol-disulfide isomerase/thioredoxin
MKEIQIALLLLLSSSVTTMIVTEKNDMALNLADQNPYNYIGITQKIEEIDRFQLYHILLKLHKSPKDMFVLFYHSHCPHCKVFLPQFNKIGMSLKRNGFVADFYAVDCAKNPHLIPAFQVTYFPFLAYFHNAVPYERMPGTFTFSVPFSKHWIIEQKKKFENKEKNKKNALKIAGMTEKEFFKRYIKLIKAYVFAITQEQLADLKKKSEKLIEKKEKTKGFKIAKGKKKNKSKVLR